MVGGLARVGGGDSVRVDVHGEVGASQACEL